MKNKIQKLILITLTMTGAFTQVGCGPMYGNEYEDCSPDRLELASLTIHKEYNGQVMGDDYWSLGPSITSDLSGLTGVEIDDSNKVSKIKFGSIAINNLDTPISLNVESFPLNLNEEKTFNINTNIEASYYSIKNISNGKIATLPPMEWVHVYEGWPTDTSFQIHFQAEGENKLFHFNVTDINNLDWTLTSENTIDESYPNVEQHFPSASPQSDMQIDLKTISKNWTGLMNVKVIENRDRKYSLEETIEITDGINIFKETNTTHYIFKNAECHTVSQYN